MQELFSAVRCQSTNVGLPKRPKSTDFTGISEVTPVSSKLRGKIVAILALTLVTSFGVVAPSQAQTSRANSSTTKSANSTVSKNPGAGAKKSASRAITATADYVLGIEDTISVASVTHEEVNLAGVQVPPDGKINLPLIGQFTVPGKTISQLQAEIKKRMETEGFLRPLVTVMLTTQRKQRVFLLNTDGTSGNVDITPEMRISDVLALAGGMGSIRPELTDASLSRLGIAQPIILDLPSILRDSNGKANIPVQHGDTIRMMPRIIEISAAGSVAKPGPVKIPVGSSLTEVMALVGGPTEKAALSRASIKRASDGTVIPVNYNDILIKGLPAPEIELREGDLLLVPEAKEQVTVQGAVGRPGYFPIEDGRTLRISELIALAGGVREDASQSRTVVQRADGTIVNVDLYRVLALNDAASNIELQPDDIITVPAYREQLVVAGTGVRTGGFIPIEEGKTMRILDALTRSGGLIGEPVGTRIVITRGMPGSVPSLTPNAAQPAPTTLVVDPVKLYKDSDPEANIPLQNGDLVMVTALPRTVFLTGHVRAPGSKDLKEGVGLVELLADAGGITETGSASDVIIERDGQKYTIDVFSALSAGETVNFALEPGDNIIVKENLNRVAVMPGVGRPGYIVIPEDRPLTLAEAMVLAGGPRDNSKLDEVVLLRQVPGGEMKRIPAPLKTDKQWIAASKVQLQAGDIVFVPDREPHRPRLLERLFRVLPVFNLLGIPLP